MADAFSCPTANGIDDVGWAFNGTEAVTQTVTEGVDDTTIRHTWILILYEGRPRYSAWESDADRCLMTFCCRLAKPNEAINWHQSASTSQPSCAHA